VRFERDAVRVRVVVGESDRFEGRPLYEAIVSRAHDQGIAGATVLRGIEGYGTRSRIHTSRILRLSEDLPVVIEIVDSLDRIESVLSFLEPMVGEGLVTVEPVQLISFRPPEGAA
jgi:PII-like signaling protein